LVHWLRMTHFVVSVAQKAEVADIIPTRVFQQKRMAISNKLFVHKKSTNPVLMFKCGL
jgi:hypothetical protein